MKSFSWNKRPVTTQHANNLLSPYNYAYKHDIIDTFQAFILIFHGIKINNDSRIAEIIEYIKNRIFEDKV